MMNLSLVFVAHSRIQPLHSARPVPTQPRNIFSMARFAMYIALLALATMAATSTADDIVDPNLVAAAANEEAATQPLPSLVDNADDKTTSTADALADTASNTAAAISDSVSNVTTEEIITDSSSASEAESDASTPGSDDTDSDSASDSASGSSASTHLTPSIALASAAVIAITGFFI